MSQLLPPSALFRFRVPCYRLPGTVENLKTRMLSDVYRLPSFQELNGQTPIADVRMAWTPQRLIWQVTVSGRKEELFCRSDLIEQSDGLHVWIDTRDMKKVQRGTRFCHRFAFLPQGSRSLQRAAVASQVWLERAGDHPVVVEEESLDVVSRVTQKGYELVASVQVSALTGLDQAAGARLGFWYMVNDRELGTQMWSFSDDYRQVGEDPSLWGTVQLEDVPS